MNASNPPGAWPLPRSDRLTSAAEFQAVFQRGNRDERPRFLALWREGDGAAQVGFTVSRQVRGAVRRNRVRRRLREAYRRLGRALPAGVKVVFVGRPAALGCAFADLQGDMRQTLDVVARAVVARAGVTGGP